MMQAPGAALACKHAAWEHPTSDAHLTTLQLVRRWRTLAGGRAVQFGPAELNQLHLVEVALRLEAPGIGKLAPVAACRGGKRVACAIAQLEVC